MNGFPDGSAVENAPVMQETWVRSVYKFALSNCIANDWTTREFAICLYGDQPSSATAVDFQHPLREFRVEWDTSAPGNLVGQVFR